MDEKEIYVGNAREIETKYGPILKVTLDLTDLGVAHRNGFSFRTEQGKDKIKIDITRKRFPDKYGNTHKVTVDTWKPDSSRGNKPPAEHNKAPEPIAPYNEGEGIY